MKLIESLYSAEEAEWLILGVPFSGKVTAHKGSEKAPAELRKAFRNYWTYDMRTGRDLFDEKIVDLGDVKAKNYSSLCKSLTEKIVKAKTANPKAKMLFIGGDHSITPIITNALKVKTMLCMDAHFDLIDKYDGKDSNSHACASRRVYEQGVEIHLRGIRSSAKEEHEFARKKNLDWKTESAYSGKVDYFSLDVDVLDPYFIGTGTPEMFGCSPTDVVNNIRNTEFKYFDIMEWVPAQGYAYVVQFVKEALLK